MAADFKYWAFISYSHKDNQKGGNLWADWLHDAIENFKVPRELVGKTGRYGEAVPARLFPVFQDDKELPTNADLGGAIQEALAQSRYLVVICSPNSAKSFYVNQEVLEFKRLGRANRIVAIIIDGEPNASESAKGFDPARECFPEALRHPLGPDGKLDQGQRAEPIAADVRSDDGKEASLRDKAHFSVLEREKLRVIAGVLGVGFDDLVQRDKERQLREEQAQASRLRKLVTGFGILALAATVAGIIAFLQKREADKHRNTAETRRQETLQTLSESHLSRAVALAGSDDGDLALAYLVASLKANPANDPARTRLASLMGTHTWMMPRLVLQHEAPVASAQYSPDGTRMVTASWDGTARVWDAQTGAAIAGPLRHDGWVVAAQFSPDGKRIVTASRDKTARVWDAQTGQPVTEPLKHGDAVYAAEFSPTGSKVLTASRDRMARIWDVSTGKEEHTAMRVNEGIHAAHFSPDGSQVVTVGPGEGPAQVWDLSEPPTVKFKLGGRWVNSAQFSADGKYLITGSTRPDTYAAVFELQNGRQLGQFMRHDSTLTWVEVSADQKRILTAARDGTARVWSTATGGRPLNVPLHHKGEITMAHFNSDSSRIVTASDDNTARVWETQSGRPLTEPLRHESSVMSAVFSPDGSHVLTASSDGAARVWEVRFTRLLNLRLKMQGGAYEAQFSPDGKKILAVSNKYGAIWDPQTGESLNEANVPRGQPFVSQWNSEGGKTSVHISPDGKRFISSVANTVIVYDAQTGKPVGTPLNHGAFVLSAQFSLDGKRVVTAGRDNAARIWEAETGKLVSGPMTHQDVIRCVQFSPDCQRIVTGSQSGTARVWEVETGKPLTEPLAHLDYLFAAQFSPDGKRIVTASADNTAKVWDAETGKAIGNPMRHSLEVVWAEFSSDGRRIVTASRDQTARVWDAESGRPLIEPIKHDSYVSGATFSPDGKWIATTSQWGARLWEARNGEPLTDPMNTEAFLPRFSADGKRVIMTTTVTARVLDLVPNYPKTPDWLPELGTAVSGYGFDEHGVLVPTRTNRLEKMKQIQTRLNSYPGDDDWAAWGRWFLAEPDVRTTSPYVKVTLSEYVDDLVRENRPDQLEVAMVLAFGNKELLKQIEKVHGRPTPAAANPNIKKPIPNR